MSMMDVPTFWQYIVKGAILFAGSLDGLCHQAARLITVS